MNTNTVRKYDFDDDELSAKQRVSEVKTLSSHQATYEFLSSLKKLKVFLISLSWATFILCSAFFLFGCSSGGGSGVPESFQSELDIAREDLRALGMPTEAMGRVDPQVLWDLRIDPQDIIFALARAAVQLDHFGKRPVGKSTDLEKEYNVLFVDADEQVSLTQAAKLSSFAGGLSFFFSPFLRGTPYYPSRDKLWIDTRFALNQKHALESCTVSEKEYERTSSSDLDSVPESLTISIKSECLERASGWELSYEDRIPTPKVYALDLPIRLEAKAQLKDEDETDSFGPFNFSSSAFEQQSGTYDNFLYSSHIDIPEKSYGAGKYEYSNLKSFQYQVKKNGRGSYTIEVSREDRSRGAFEKEELWLDLQDFYFSLDVSFPKLQELSDKDIESLITCVNEGRTEGDGEAQVLDTETRNRVYQCQTEMRRFLKMLVVKQANGFIRYYRKDESRAFILSVKAENLADYFKAEVLDGIDKNIRVCSGTILFEDGEGNKISKEIFYRKESSSGRCGGVRTFNGKAFEIKYFEE